MWLWKERESSRWVRALIIGLAIFGLTVSVTTRTFRLKASDAHVVKSAQAQPLRQHMDRDATQWAPPVTEPVVFELPVFYPRVAPAGPPLARLFFDESLFNRPPPSV